MSKCLLMLTSSFPFGKGETYIENEISHYIDFFDKIIVLPIELDPNAPQTRELADGIETVNVSSKKQIVARVGDVFKGLRGFVNPSEFYEYDRAEIGGNFKKRMFFEYFCNRSLRSFDECLKVLKDYDLQQYDSITVYSYWFFVPAMVGVLFKRYFSEFCNDVKLISRAHRYDVYEDRNVLGYLPLREFLLENCDAVFPCSASGTNHIVSRYPKYADKIKTAYLGTVDKGLSKQTENGIHIVSCSQIIEVKRVEKIAEILEILEKISGAKLKWTHIGDGIGRKTIENSAKQKLRSVDVNFLGNVPNLSVYEYYMKNAVDLFLSTSKSEGLPVSMMEAASFGVPIISTNVGGVSEIVHDGFNGKLLDSDASAESFAKAINDYFNKTDAEKKKYRQNSRRLWEENFNADRVYSSFFAEEAALL